MEEKIKDENENEETSAVSSELQQQSINSDDGIEEKAEINKLLDEGYSVKQIIDLGFKRRTVYYHAKKRTKPENEPATGSDAATASPTGKAKYDIMKLGAKDVIPPEAVLDVIHLPQNGDAVEVWRRGVIDGMGILLLGARYSQLTAAGQADVVKNQLDILREAKEGSKDIAREAAHETALEMANQILQRIPKPEPAPNEPSIANKMLGPMADIAGKQMANLFSRMFGGMLGMNPEGQASSIPMPSGWEYEKQGGNQQ